MAILGEDEDNIRPIGLSDNEKKFPGILERESWEEETQSPVKMGFHPFNQTDHAHLIIVKNLDGASDRSTAVYGVSSMSEVNYYHINAQDVVQDSKLPAARLLLSIKCKLNSTRDAAEVFNCRQLFQIGQEVFVFVEYGHEVAHETKIDTQLADIENLEGLILSGSLDLILEEFMIWLVEVDPIGFELLRRMNRDGFVESLKITEEVWQKHDSDNLTDKWFSEITNYADSIELSCQIPSENDKDSLMFNVTLRNAVANADSFTRTDFYRHSKRQDWISPQLRENNYED